MSEERRKYKSFSEISTYLECQRLWYLQYVLGHQISGPHLTFGSMAHKVLETREIPDETLYPELKEFFNIQNWNKYFTNVFKALDEYFEDYELIEKEIKINNGILVGVIDSVWKHKVTGRYLIVDYKFATREKTLEELNFSEQLHIYGLLFYQNYHIPLDNIDVAYISIPKTDLDEPRVLKSGQLSKDKSQNVTYDSYLNKIEELGLNKDDYEDILIELVNRKLLSINLTSINMDFLTKTLKNIENVIIDMDKGYILEKFNHQCKYCSCKDICKQNKGEL